MLNQSLKNLNNWLRVASVFALTTLYIVSGYAQDAASAADPAVVEKGKTLFTNNCAACHSVTAEKLIGPGLQGVSKRRPEAWLIKWVKNSPAVIASGDAYANEIFNKYGKVAMTAFTNFSDDDVKSIIAYVDASNVAPAAAAGTPAAAGAAVGAGESQPSGLFSAILIVLLIVMILVLVALLAMVNMLAKANKIDTDGATRQVSFAKQATTTLETLGSHPAFKTGALLLFLLLAGKATLDGLYGVGIHQGYAPKQPIEFSHKLHAGEFQINCNYCHTGVYKGKGANIPSANICMNCHNAIKRESPEIQKIYHAIENDQPIEWVRVHNLPDLAYFNHAQHTNVGGLQCKQCHGDIEKMEVVEQRSSLTMGWCIDCHRETNVNAAGNAYYDKLLEVHKKEGGKDLKVANIGGLECSKCHY